MRGFDTTAGTNNSNIMNTQQNPFEYHNNKLGVSIKFLVSDESKRDDESLRLITYKALNKRFVSKTQTEQQLRRASLGFSALAEFNTLHQDWRDLLTVTFGKPIEKVKQSYFASHYVADREAFDFFCQHRFGKNNERKLDPEVIELYTYNASVLNAVIAVKTNRKAYVKALGGVKINIWDSLSKDVNAFRDVAHNLPTTPTSLRHKVTKYNKLGYTAIISRKYGNTSASKVVLSEQQALLDELIAKHTNLDNEIIATLYNAVANRLTDWKTITSGTVANRKKEIGLVANSGRNGVKYLGNNMLMQNKRKAPSSPMKYWTLDGWDAELLYQKTSINKEGRSVTTFHNRLTVVVVLDAHQKYPIGYAIGTHETPKLIFEALQNAMNHTKELFGEYHRPYQIQSDNYSIKKLRPLYEALTKHFTPAAVGNAKAKIIEPYFGYINKKYAKLHDNWSGHNVNSGSKNQPNSEMLNKIRNYFPDELGCRNQITAIIETERQTKRDSYVANWVHTKMEHRLPMDFQQYMLVFGSSTGNTNKLRGDGISLVIDGVKKWYDCFNPVFRHHAHEDWKVLYNPNDLSKALAISKDEKLVFELEEKYIQAMCIADQAPEDHEQLKRVNGLNKFLTNEIIETRANNYDLIEDLINENPQLNDTMAKHLIVDSLGQHKNIKSSERISLAKAQAIETKHLKKEAKAKSKNFQESQQDYYSSKINVNEYL